MSLLYNLIFFVLYLLVLPKFIVRMIKRGGYAKDFCERFGIFSQAKLRQLSDSRRIWIHAVSVGELSVAFKIAEKLRRIHPHIPMAFSVTTSTAHAIAEKRIGDNDILFYFPMDLPLFLRRVFKVVQPQLIVLIESELWPNLITFANKSNVPILLVNGRISSSSFKGYLLLKSLFQKVLAGMDRLLMQSEVDKERIIAIGAPTDRVEVMGTIKYDEEMPSEKGMERILASLAKHNYYGGEKIVVVGGSTWPGEEKILIDIVYRVSSINPQIRLLLVPRHVERTHEIQSIIKTKGLNCILWSSLKKDEISFNATAKDILLVDTTGELKYFYGAATIVFVGKSLTYHGGQNIVEPAVLGKPIIVGPNMENFLNIMNDFLSEKAIIQVASQNELEKAVGMLLNDRLLCDEIGKRAANIVAKNRGALDKCIKAISSFIIQ